MCLTQQIKAYLIDLCYMSLNQLELALKKKTSKLRTPVSIDEREISINRNVVKHVNDQFSK